MKYRIRHRTRYDYPAVVSQCFSLTHLLPRDTRYQKCSRSSITVDPLPAFSSRRSDYFGNNSYYFSVQFPHRYLEVVAESEVEILDPRQSMPLDFGASCAEVRSLLQNLEPPENVLAREFLLDSPRIRRSQALADYARGTFRDELPFLSCVRSFTSKIYAEFEFDPRATQVTTPPEEVLANRRGVCQDFAHLAIGCLRSLGYPARYVSGYLETLPPPGSPRLEGADASHAWFAVYSPIEGWADFDPTNDRMAAEQHITTAWGRDYSDVTPLKGSVFGGGTSQQLKVAVDVERVEA